MKWSKLDARLATALGDDPDGADSYGRLNVFIRCRPGARKRAFDDLQKIVHSRVSKVGRDFVTASVGRDEVAELSEQPWVQSITLSSVLHPHGSDQIGRAHV